MISNLLHFIWLGTAPTFEAWIGMRRWEEACFSNQPNGFLPVLWVDRAALLQIENDPKFLFSGIDRIKVFMANKKIDIRGVLRSRMGRPIPVAVIEENEAHLSKINVTPPEFKIFFASILFEAKLRDGGVPVLASDMLRILLVLRYGGIYVDAVGLIPKLVPLTVNNLESLLKGVKLLSAGCENYAIIADNNDPHVRRVLLEVISKYILCYKDGPEAGFERRCQAYLNTPVKPSDLQKEEFKNEIYRMNSLLTGVSLGDVATLHSKRHPGLTPWMHTFASEKPYLFEEEGDIFSSDEPKPKPLPQLSTASKEVQKFKATKLAAVLADDISIGYSFFIDKVAEYHAQHGLKTTMLHEYIFGKTPLKGHMICSHEFPLISKARRLFEATRLIQDFYKKHPKR